MLEGVEEKQDEERDEYPQGALDIVGLPFHLIAVWECTQEALRLLGCIRQMADHAQQPDRSRLFLTRRAVAPIGGLLLVAAVLGQMRAFVLLLFFSAVPLVERRPRFLAIAIQQVESSLLTPLVMKRSVDVPPVVTILAGAVMTILFGFFGLLAAVPFAAVLLTIAREVTPEVDDAMVREA